MLNIFAEFDIFAFKESITLLLGGLIEVIPYNDLLLVCNEEGKLEILKIHISCD